MAQWRILRQFLLRSPKRDAYFEPKEWLWNPPPPPIASDPVTGWSLQSRRVGVIGVKLGMTTEYDQWGNIMGITVIQIDKCQVIQVKTVKTDGHCALQLGSGFKKEKNTTNQMLGHFRKATTAPKRFMHEFRVTEDAILPVGTEIFARHFVPGQYVDVQGITIGKGFQGPMKRWGFGGLRASHGVSVSHRSHGSTGGRQDPGKVFKNKKMAGHMGGKQRTAMNLMVYKINTKKNLLYLKGCVPGHDQNRVFIRDSILKSHPFPSIPPFPTYYPTDNEPEEIVARMPRNYKFQDAYWEEKDVTGKPANVWDVRKQILSRLRENGTILMNIDGSPVDQRDDPSVDKIAADKIVDRSGASAAPSTTKK